MHDLVVRGGTVVDGTGAEPRTADLAIDAGIVVAVGRVAARGREEMLAHDLPGGARRLLQRARGYEATVVSGEVTFRDGEHTGALPGRLVRGA